MEEATHLFQRLIEQASEFGPIRVAVVDAAQRVVIETLKEAHELGMVEPLLIGSRDTIASMCADVGWNVQKDWIVPSDSDAESAKISVKLIRDGEAHAVMKGQIHTDILMHALLDKDTGLRLPGQRVSHLFVVETHQYPKLLGVTDAAINISPDLNAKAQIVQNAVHIFHLLGIAVPKVAILSAVETVSSEIVSTVDAACLTLMAQRGQITDAILDGPLAFDNAISLKAAEEKGISSPVAGDADILLVPDLISGNILAKNLAYFTGATTAGIALGMAAPVILTSRADPAKARLASLSLAALVHHRQPSAPQREAVAEPTIHCTPQVETACCPLVNL